MTKSTAIDGRAINLYCARCDASAGTTARRIFISGKVRGTGDGMTLMNVFEADFGSCEGICAGRLRKRKKTLFGSGANKNNLP